jgi:hypothetical protein
LIPSPNNYTTLDITDSSIFRSNDGEVYLKLHLIEEEKTRQVWLYSFTMHELLKIEVLNSPEQENEAHWTVLPFKNSFLMIYNH